MDTPVSAPAGLVENYRLAPLTTFGIGGPARWFTRAASEDDLAAACAWAAERRLPVFVLGGGSNILVSDQGFPGLVLQVGLSGIERDGDRFTVAAGESWDAFVDYAIEGGCAGVECLAGIPGTVGGTPVQNVGAYGQEVAETIESVRCLDRRTLRFVQFSAAECGFAYRRSRFNQGPDRDRYLVSQVIFRLRPGASPRLKYADLQQYFTGRSEPTLVEAAAAVRTIRARKGMVIPPGDPLTRDPDTRSAGSFFKNPVIAEPAWERLHAEHPELPGWPAAAEDGAAGRKLPAAWLLEHAGFPRGYALGDAALSSKHTLALTNRSGNASAASILALRDVLTSGVEKRFGVRLEPEPILVGFGPPGVVDRGCAEQP